MEALHKARWAEKRLPRKRERGPDGAVKIEREEVHTRPGVVTAKSGNAPGRGTERNGVGRRFGPGPETTRESMIKEVSWD